MGRGRKGGGVEIRPKSLRLHFTWNGNRCRETLDMPPTPVNAKYAARLVAEIKLRIETGTFRYTDYFPNSVRATCQPAARYRTVREYGEMWLASRSDLDKKTLYEYGQSLKFWYAQRT